MKEKLVEAAVDLVKNKDIQDKTSNLFGMIFPYIGIRKEAVDCYITEIEKSDLSPELKAYTIYNTKQTFKKFKNQHDIAQIAIENSKEGTDFSINSKVDKEWFDRFMNSAGYVSSDEVKIIWGKILSKEYENPGSTPFNMTRILSEITPKYAKIFKNICSMRRPLIVIDESGKGIHARENIVVPFDENNDYFTNLGITFNSLCELETLGLIKFDNITGFKTTNIPKGRIIVYIDGITKEIKGEHNDIPIGCVILTSAGKCIKNIIEADKIENYNQEEGSYMKKQGIEYLDNCEYSISITNDTYHILKNQTIQL